MREILLVHQPTFPSARLLHTLRWLARRDSVAVEIWDEEQAFEVAYTAPETLTDTLIHVPHGLFPDGSQLREQLRLAGVHWNYLAPGPPGGLLAAGALSAWLAGGTPEPLDHRPGQAWTPRRQAPAGTLPEDDATFVDSWLGLRAEWHGVPLAVRRLP